MFRGLVAFAITAFVLGMMWLLWARTGVNFANQQLMWQGGAPERAAQWGDTFGAFNAFFGALGFAAVMATLWTQSHALSEQKSDLHRQRFESTFFQMLKMIREGREQVRFKHSETYRIVHPRAARTILTSHAAFRAAYREMRYWVKQERHSGSLSKDDIARIYAEQIHARFESTFGAYYRLVYAALDRVRTDRHLSDQEKDDLGNLVRGQFTSFEAILAGCNGLNAFAKDFDEIAIRFRLLKYGRRGVLYDELRKFYPADAFLGRGEVEEPAIESDDDDEYLPDDEQD
jgi:hypothetical protein